MAMVYLESWTSSAKITISPRDAPERGGGGGITYTVHTSHDKRCLICDTVVDRIQ